VHLSAGVLSVGLPGLTGGTSMKLLGRHRLAAQGIVKSAAGMQPAELSDLRSNLEPAFPAPAASQASLPAVHLRVARAWQGEGWGRWWAIWWAQGKG
jgi:hypothetical protein